MGARHEAIYGPKELFRSERRSAQKRIFSWGIDGETRNRTGDTTIFSRVLYQLSYLAVAGRS